MMLCNAAMLQSGHVVVQSLVCVNAESGTVDNREQEKSALRARTGQSLQCLLHDCNLCVNMIDM